MKPEEISLKDKFVWNDDCFVIPVSIPKKGDYEYSHALGETKVFCSKGEKDYELDYFGDSWICSCPGYGYRRHCSHLENLPKKIRKRVETQKIEKKEDDIGPCQRAAMNAFHTDWNPKTGKYEQVYNEDGTKRTAYDHFWIDKPMAKDKFKKNDTNKRSKS